MSNVAASGEMDHPAQFKSSPGVDPILFPSLKEALGHAAKLTAMYRHPRALIITDGGIHYGWKEIDELTTRHHITSNNRQPSLSHRRSSRD